MSAAPPARRTVALYPWYRFCQNLVFFQAIWFLYFQDRLSAGEAVLLYAVYDLATTVLEVPSGYLSDRVGRRVTLIAAAAATTAGAATLALADGFAIFVLGQMLLGVGAALLSGTDSALLFEALAADGRAAEIEGQEVKAWRFSFAALALSAVLGGALAMVDGALAFAATAVAGAGALAIATRLAEPPHSARVIPPQGREWQRLRALGAALRHPVLLWLLCLSLLMYVFSHVPYVFGQPFILQALSETGLEGEAPLVSGGISAAMMVVSVGASLLAPGLRQGLGLGGILLLAFGMQIALCAALMLSDAAPILVLLFLRMVPDALSRPFILARIQPLLGDESRATFLSIKSLAGRLMFAGTLALASLAAPDTGAMSHETLSLVMQGYVAAGLLALAMLAVTSVRIGLEAPRQVGGAGGLG